MNIGTLEQYLQIEAAIIEAIENIRLYTILCFEPDGSINANIDNRWVTL